MEIQAQDFGIEIVSVVAEYLRTKLTGDAVEVRASNINTDPFSYY